MTGCLDFTRDDPEVAQLGMGAAALRYQRMGYAVLGLGVGSKRPHSDFKHGVSWATRDQAMPWWLWRTEPLAGVGIATGQVNQLVVIDLDLKHGENGVRNFGDFLVQASAVGVMDCTVPMDTEVSTPGGGWHIWLRTPAGYAVPSRPGILPGVDIQGDGHYVVAPPSRVWVDSDQGSALLPYRQVNGCPCEPPWAPAWFLRWIEQAQATGTDHGKTGVPLPDVEQLKQTGLERGSRNTTLHRLACSLFRRLPDNAEGYRVAMGELELVLAATDMRGFSRAEVDRTITSAREFVRRARRDGEAAWDQSIYGRR